MTQAGHDRQPIVERSSRRAVVAFLSRLLIVSAALVSGGSSAPAAQTAGIQTSTPIPGFAASLQMITELLDRGRGIEAENVARALLARVETTRGRDAQEVADVLDLLGRAVRRSSKVKDEEKTEFAERAVAIREKALGPAHPQLAASLINLGVQRALAGDPASGKPLLERALAIQETALGRDHPLIAGTLQSLAGLLMTLHDDAGATALLERAQRSRELVRGAGHPEAIRTLVNLAIVYQETGDYAGARQRYERARTLAEQLRGNDLLTLHVLAGTAVVLSELAGDPAGSARLNEHLVNVTERAFGTMDPRLTAPLENLAMDFRDLGEYAAALAAAQRALAIAERALGPHHPDVASSLHTVATVLAGLGDYAGAMRLFERATQINEQVLQPGERETVRASFVIRELLPLSGYGPDDAELFERVIAMRGSQRGLADPRTAESLANLAALLSTADDYLRTRPLFERALEAQERFLGPDHPEVGAAAGYLADVLSRTGENERAQRLYQRAVTIWERSLGADHPKVATGLGNLARFYLRIGNYQDAGPLLVRALEIQEKSLGPDHPDVALTLATRAELEADTGATREAFATAVRAEALSREHLRLTIGSLPERQALSYASSLPPSTGLMLHLAAMHPEDGTMVTEVWNAVVRARGVVFDEVAARHRLSGAEGASGMIAFATPLASARQRLAALVVRGIRNDPPDRYRGLLEEARAGKDASERAFAEHSAKFRDDQSRTRLGLAQVVAALPPDSALVAFVRDEDRRLAERDGQTPPSQPEPSYFALVSSGGNRQPVLVPLGSAARIDALILQWRKQLDQEAMAGGTGASRGEANYRRIAGELRRQVWDPLSAHLQNATRVFVVPDGALHLVSLAALPTAASSYLVETGPMIHYLSAERDLVPAEDDALTGHGLLALGDPAFDQSSVAVVPGAAFRGPRSGCPDFQSTRFESLPGSLKEVDAVVTLWNQAESSRTTVPVGSPPVPFGALKLTGAAASESAFKAQAAGRRILHLATHGFFLEGRCAASPDPSGQSTAASVATVVKQNPLILSGLILAGANHRNAAAPDQEDGVLTAEEVAALNLNGVEWAVLSGCDTGVGEVRAGAGVFGLRRAFQAAGARTVIMSLWPVEDQTTRQWMTTLYRARLTRKLSTARAVREAGLALLRARRTRGLSAHPFYWAAFVATGDWR